jgi:hypothetical protein
MAEIARNVAVALTVAGALIGGPRQSAAADGEAVTNTTHTSTTGAVRETQAATDAGATVIVAGRANAQTPVLLGFMESDIRVAVRRAVEGAAGRLARPGCQDLFADFTDEGGQRLSTTLAATGNSPTEALSVLRFFDDGAAPQCRAGRTLAFTQTGSRLIRVCGPQFRERFLQNRTTTEIVVIHELLHTLGLGENPPTSEVISQQVRARCTVE